MKTPEHWRPQDYDFIVDPYPHYEELRKKCNLFKSPSGDYVLLSYDLVKEAFLSKDFEVGVRKTWINDVAHYARGKGKDYEPIKKAVQSIPLNLNPPEHTEVRTLLTRNWPRKQEVSAIVERCVHDVLSRLSGRSQLVQTLSHRLPLKVINEIVGTHAFTSQQHVEDAIHILNHLDPYLTVKDLEKINDASSRLYAAFSSFYEELNQDGTSISAKIKRFCTTNPDIAFDPVSLLISFFIAGLGTTSSLISGLVFTLLTEEGLHLKLTSDRLVTNFIHEVLRLHSPVHLSGRTNVRDIEMDGVLIPAKSIITLCVGSANRDPGYFENPNEINLERDQHHQIAFGQGIHHCIGYQIAMAEAFEFLRHFLKMIPSIKLIEEPELNNQLTFRSFRSINVEFDG